MFKSLKYLLSSMAYTMCAIVYFRIVAYMYNTCIESTYALIIDLINSSDFRLFDIIKLGLIIFGFIFMSSTFLCSAFRLFSNLYKFFMGDNIDYDINITVDDNYVLRDSYMEFSDGTRVPMHITKVSFKKSKEEQENGEEKA